MAFRSSSFLAAGVFAWLTLGCDPAPQGAGSSTPTQARSAPVPDPILTARPPSRGRVIGGESVRRLARMPDRQVSEFDASPQFRAELEQSPIPVLAPARLPDDARLMQGDGWYAITVHEVDHTVHLQASTRARLHPGIAPTRGDWELRGTHGFVTQNEGIWSVSWVENGVAYSLEIECAAADAGPCRDEDAAVDLVESLEFVGGGRSLR